MWQAEADTELTLSFLCFSEQMLDLGWCMHNERLTIDSFFLPWFFVSLVSSNITGKGAKGKKETIKVSLMGENKLPLIALFAGENGG